MLKVGLFFGSFNPIHIGHLALANYIAEFTDLNEVWFIISPLNPLKNEIELASEESRLKMVNIAIKSYAKFKACDIEFSLPKPSYTINTLNRLKELYNHQFVMIMGSDNIIQIEKWKEAETILNNYELIIYPRKDFLYVDNNVKNIKLLELAPELEISSTFIRQAIINQKDVQYFLHPDVNQYIKENRIYPIKN